VIELYLADLARELRAKGVRGRAAARVLAEARDHLLELEQAHGAIDRFGPSERIAREVAAQLATTRTFRATYAAFAALALTAAAYVLFFASINRGSVSPDLFSARHEAVGVAATLGLVLFPQIAFVAGCLALLRALRLRGVSTLSAEELHVIRRRAAVALAADGALERGIPGRRLALTACRAGSGPSRCRRGGSLQRFGTRGGCRRAGG
jgi:hypothetical protein